MVTVAGQRVSEGRTALSRDGLLVAGERPVCSEFSGFLLHDNELHRFAFP